MMLADICIDQSALLGHDVNNMPTNLTSLGRFLLPGHDFRLAGQLYLIQSALSRCLDDSQA